MTPWSICPNLVDIDHRVTLVSSGNVLAMPSRTGLAAASVTIVVWASAFPTIRVALRHFGPLELSALRVLVAAAVLSILAPIFDIGLPRRQDRMRVFVAGVIGMTTYLVLLNTGEQVVEAAPAAVLIATGPIWVAVLSTRLIGEGLSWLGWVGIGLAFTGVVIVALGQGGGLRFQPSALLILGAALAQASYIVLTKPLLSRYRPLQVATWAMVAGAVAALPLLAGVPAQLSSAPTEGLLSVVYLGVFPSALGFVFWGRALVDAPASVVSTTLYTIPPLATLLAWVWLGERPGVELLIGGAVILVGVALVVGKGSRSGRAA